MEFEVNRSGRGALGGTRRFASLTSRAPRSCLVLRGAPGGTRTPDPQVRRPLETQEITPSCVSCLAGSGVRRHRAASATAPGSIRLRVWGMWAHPPPPMGVGLLWRVHRKSKRSINRQLPCEERKAGEGSRFRPTPSSDKGLNECWGSIEPAIGFRREGDLRARIGGGPARSRATAATAKRELSGIRRREQTFTLALEHASCLPRSDAARLNSSGLGRTIPIVHRKPDDSNRKASLHSCNCAKSGDFACPHPKNKRQYEARSTYSTVRRRVIESSSAGAPGFNSGSSDIGCCCS